MWFYFLILFGLSNQSIALDFDSQVSVGGYYSDQRIDNQQGEWINQLELVGTLQQQSKHLETQANSEVSVEDDQVNAQVQSELNWHIRPQQVDWLFRNVLQQIQQNSQQLNTQDNRQHVHQFTSGPTLQLRLSPVDSLNLHTLYTQTDTQNQHRAKSYEGHMAWSHRLAPYRDLNSQITLFRQQDGTQATRSGYKASVGIQSRLYQSTQSFDIGWNGVEQQGQQQSDLLWRLGWDYALDRQRHLIFSIGDALSDTRQINSQQSNTTSQLQTRGGELRYQQQFGRGSFSIGYSQALTRISQQLGDINPVLLQEDFSVDDDITVKQWQTSYQSNTHNRLQWSMDMGYSVYDYANLDRDYNAWYVVFDARYPLFERFSVGSHAKLQWIDGQRLGKWGISGHYAINHDWQISSGFRQSQQQDVDRGDYTKNELFLSLDY